MRACIGRAFAWQEGHIAVAMILQNFNLQAVDPSYSMKLRQTLTIKPTDFKFRASLRDGLDATSLEQRLWGGKREHEMNGTHEEKATDVSMALHWLELAKSIPSFVLRLTSVIDSAREEIAYKNSVWVERRNLRVTRTLASKYCLQPWVQTERRLP